MIKKGKQIGPEIAAFRLSELKPAGYNPRVISDEAMKGLTASLSRFGCVEPIVVNCRGGKKRIVGGHQRYKALLELHGKDYNCPCVTVDLSATDEQLLNIALNNPHIQGEFSEDLAAMIDQLRAEMPGESALVDLRIEQIKRELLGTEKEKFTFRPGEAHLKANGPAGNFWLKNKELARFKKYKTFILDFSGGRDSTLALAWIVRHFADRDIYAVYADTGVEFPGMGAHIEETCEFFGVHCEIRKPETEWWAWLRREKQWPSLLWRPCQGVFIFSVTAQFRKQFALESTLLLDGSRATQAGRGSKKTIDSPVGSMPNYEAYHPCFNLTEESSTILLTQIKAPLWEGYERGFVRSACWCCPGQCGLQAAALQDNYPGLADDIRRWEKRIGVIQPLVAGGGRSFDDEVAAGRKQLEQKAKKAAKKAVDAL